MNRIEELEQEIGERYAELHAIKAKATDKENTSLVGKCFKYRNSYSCPGPDDHWWLYAQVLRAKGGSLYALTFQTDNAGKIEIEPDRHFSKYDGHIPILLTEFAEAWGELLKRVDSIAKTQR